MPQVAVATAVGTQLGAMLIGGDIRCRGSLFFGIKN